MTQVTSVACSPLPGAGALVALEGQVCSLHEDLPGLPSHSQLLGFQETAGRRPAKASSPLQGPPPQPCKNAQ